MLSFKRGISQFMLSFEREISQSMLSIEKGNKSIHAVHWKGGIGQFMLLIGKGNKSVHAVHGKVMEGGRSIRAFLLFIFSSYIYNVNR